MNRILRNLIIYLLAVFPTIIVVHLLINYYPNTGLGRIVAIPIIFIINTLIIVAGIIIQKISRPYLSTISWLVLIITTIFVAVSIYPQEYGPPVIEQIINRWFMA
ncbi:hypothetical protein Back11_57600 [Paenibacillus baekrokdamisoli]|uniref:Uncharacterized protein n=1 Tax=Paenibacillus baekrokdamisoli TaxID=1712516 RepID=A0A3G9J7U0_9BACL|nr:hypothetical protein [Paenibacillus baekrokdamisoli]MBB3072857.1 glucan phosphoethanolaminetransferase (alkaline phosphatase superfamily) [Paenibacillus baekrokdamisoli]BBH24415.1 hypothetical protein Back11_57600 [Paenibacillus baekrokdamisoli]